MKTRRHHNNKGYRQIKRGKTFDQVRRMARKLKLPFVVAKPAGRAALTEESGASPSPDQERQ